VKLRQRSMSRPSLGGMLATRQGALILAVLCAVCAAGVLVFALGSYKANVQTPTATPQATVLVATGEIQQGTPGDLVASEKLYKSTPVAATQLTPGAISDASELQGKITETAILPGQQLTTTDFAATQGVTGVTALLSPHQRALSVPTDEVHGDLDVLVPGDHVDLYDSFAAGGGTEVGLLDPDVLVIKTPASGIAGAVATATNAGKSSTPAAPAGTTLVLAVSTALVPQLELTADAGKIWVALRPAKATAPVGGIATIGSVLALAGSSVASNTSTSNTNANTTGKHP
jgi:pilus assembly protein CpaB